MKMEKNIKKTPSSLSNSCGPPTRHVNQKKLTRNPYLNYLSEFRKRNPNLPAVETIRKGAQEWKSLPREKKIHYIEAAFYTPKSKFTSRKPAARDCSCKRDKNKRVRHHTCQPKSRTHRRKRVC